MLVLEAAYEATMAVAVQNRSRTGRNRLFLTLLGGGAFGNSSSWIMGAMDRALERFAHEDLEVNIVSYGSSNSAVRRFVEKWS